jgi:RHS repeat-associated protein
MALIDRTSPHAPATASMADGNGPPAVAELGAEASTSAGTVQTQPDSAFTPPSITLPKGGGAIRGIGEKFTANPVTGTGSFTVPISASAGRSGFGPTLTLNYDSGQGNGLFGLGWSLQSPAITRRTDKMLPLYQDADESDVFILSGAEDLVPVLDDTHNWARLDLGANYAPGYRVDRYRPRIEGLFARIERWTDTADGTVHWRSISRDNVTTRYGATADSRIADPADPSRVFAWLICETYDDRGNAIIYQYKPDNSDNVDTAAPNEANRAPQARTANRYPKRIRYGNQTPRVPGENLHARTDWMFEVVFDYGEHNPTTPTPQEDGPWLCRRDPFSTYKPGFELRIYRLCQRVLMFHHFPAEPEVGANCLVSSTELSYASSDPQPPDEDGRGGSLATVLAAVTHRGYRRDGAGYLSRTMPPVEFDYSPIEFHDTILDVDSDSLAALPAGLATTGTHWVDLDGEGIPGALIETPGAWSYKANLGNGRFAAAQTLPTIPAQRGLGAGTRQLVDVTDTGQLDVVDYASPAPGYYARSPEGGWESFRPFSTLPNLRWDDPNLRFVDLDGDGHPDVLLTDTDVFTWYPSRTTEGFAPAQRNPTGVDDDHGPRLVFADADQSFQVADMSGDGLADLVRIRDGEVAYWPNLGHGRFGPRIIMDHSPRFDRIDAFDPKRVQLGDVDGSGTTDLIYLQPGAAMIWLNQSGNSYADPVIIATPAIDNLAQLAVADLLGTGTACLVWSSPLPNYSGRSLRYIDLLNSVKPYLLVGMRNNLGAETHLTYASSTQFYLADKAAGRPWVTRLPFPVHVVEHVETLDRISRNQFTTRYVYHHGYFDGIEREFHGFGMVERWDTEEFRALATGGQATAGTNIDASSHIPPVLTKTWFHTGAYDEVEAVSRHFAGEYYGAPKKSDPNYDAAFEAFYQALLPDTVIPPEVTPAEAREACRALKGSMLRHEIYAQDGTDEAQHPYTVSEQNFTIRKLQPRSSNRHSVFFTHAHESISYHYERKPADPRVGHALTLEVDDFGDVLKAAAIGYGRLQPDPDLSPVDQATQAQILITYTENRVTNAVDAADDHRSPLPSESLTHELTGLTLLHGRDRFTFDEVLEAAATAVALEYEKQPTPGRSEKRLIEHVRTYYRRNNLNGSLPLGVLESLALPFDSYKLAFTPGLVADVYGDRLPAAMLANEGRYVHTEGDTNWWIPSGQTFYCPNPDDLAAQEFAYARQHFFLPHRYRDPFHTNTVSTESFVTYDAYDLLVEETRDALDNRVTVGERDTDPTKLLVRRAADYRVLQPALVMDPNRNRSAVAFDALGSVVGTAVMGKPAPAAVEGDSLDGFTADLTQAEIDQFLANPKGPMAAKLLADATTRYVYDPNVYWREADPAKTPPAVAATVTRETHVSALSAGQQSKIQVSLSYSDGFGREIQKKTQAESGPAPQRDGSGSIIVGADGQPLMTPNDVSPRWVGSAWTVFNNKGKPVRQYEPFFTGTHCFEFDVKIGVSSVLFYDPVERVVATLHPDHTWKKVVFDPWRQETWDVNDTVLIADPKADADVGEFFGRLSDADYLPTWYALRTDATQAAALAAHYPDATDRINETRGAEKTRNHAATPTVAHADSLGRAVLTVAHNKTKYGHTLAADPPVEQFPATRIILDIEGNQREVIDAEARVVMRYDYDMLGNPIHQASMEAGERWMLNDVAGKSLYAWDSRDLRFRTAYDALRRPTDSLLSEARGAEKIIGRSIYGEGRPNPEDDNLRGKVAELNDQAGKVTNTRIDFKGNVLCSQRRLARDYKATLDWSDAVPLEPQTYTSCTRYDALNRTTQLIAPHSDQPDTQFNVIQPGYNEANLLDKVDAWLSQEAKPDNLLDPATANLHVVTDTDYDVKGQRLQIAYGNGATTSYTYDPLTFRLTHLLTRRNTTSFPGDCPQMPPADWPGCQVQNLHYTYDPAGNITHIRDDAQQTIYFRNTRVEPSAEYTYDAIYRLIEATGREHLGQAGAPIAYSYDDAPRIALPHPNDGNSMGRYLELYVYDAVGNFLSMQHRSTDPAHPGWTRTYNYTETSQLEPGKHSNRLTSTTIGATTETYSTDGDGYDPHGNMVRMPHLGAGSPEPNMHWDYKHQLHETDLGGGGRAYYVYDDSGQRVRKVWEKSAALIEERIYIGGFEIFRRRMNLDGVDTSMLERETLHVMDDTGRLALVETRTLDRAGDDKAPERLIRYQFGNHLGSASIELDDQAQIISYEEYAPYGSTTYQAVRNQTETPKRYRYTGKERDEESGFYYHGARYYPPWLGRWTSADPQGMADGVNLFAYGRNNPLTFSDPTGTTCDPTMQSCIDPTEPTAREEALQQSLPENERDLPPPGAPPSAGSSTSGGSLSLFGNLLRSAAPSAPVAAGIPAAAPGTDFAAAAAQARQAYRAANVMPPGTQVQHWTKELSAAATNMDPAVMNLNLSPLQSRNALPATTLLVDPNGGGTTYLVDGGSVFGNEHKFADRFLIPQIEDQIRAANPSATPREVAEASGRQARWAMTGDPGPSALPPFPEAGMSSSGRWITGGAGALNFAGGAFMLASVDTERDPGIVTAGKITSGSASVIGGGMEMGGALFGSAGLAEAGAAASGVGLVVAVPIMAYEMRPRGWMAQDPVLLDRAIQARNRGENVNPFCAQCHGPGGALDPNNDWNAGGARRAAFVKRLQWTYLGD